MMQPNLFLSVSLALVYLLQEAPGGQGLPLITGSCQRWINKFSNCIWPPLCWARPRLCLQWVYHFITIIIATENDTIINALTGKHHENIPGNFFGPGSLTLELIFFTKAIFYVKVQKVGFVATSKTNPGCCFPHGTVSSGFIKTWWIH